jgi:hypothetical protein
MCVHKTMILICMYACMDAYVCMHVHNKCSCHLCMCMYVCMYVYVCMRVYPYGRLYLVPEFPVGVSRSLFTKRFGKETGKMFRGPRER